MEEAGDLEDLVAGAAEAEGPRGVGKKICGIEIEEVRDLRLKCFLRMQN